MINHNKHKDNRDFLDFMNSEEINPPDELSNKILDYVKNDLNPSHKIVFGKLLGIQAFIGFFTLIFCPQFNLSLTNNYELFHYFHHNFGESICMAVCGSIFIGSGALLAAYILKASEIRKIKHSRFLYYFSITSIILTTFLLLGADVYLKFAMFWFIGAYTGGLVLFEINRVIRKAVFNY